MTSRTLLMLIAGYTSAILTPGCASGVEIQTPDADTDAASPPSFDNDAGPGTGATNTGTGGPGGSSGQPGSPPPYGSGSSGGSSYDSGSSGGFGDASSGFDGGGFGDGGFPYDAGAFDGGGGGSVPATCAAADDKIGCCDGNTVYWCSSGSVSSKSCSSGEVCGWDTSKSYYGCVAAPGGADPTGTYPLGCM